MSGAVVAPTSMQKATAAAAAVKAKAKAAFEKIKPKFGERITIAGEPVYLDMPEDSKVHADRIYLKKHYLHEDTITENTKEVYRRFTAEKKVASCKKDDLDILQKGLSYRLQTVEAEAADLSEKRGNSVPLRQKLGHAQGLRDLLEVVKGEVLLCANKEAAAVRRKAEEDAAAAAAALDNKPRGIEEKEIQTLVKKFAILILHASDPIEEDRPRLNKPAKNLIARLDAAPTLEGKGLETFIDNHIYSSPLLMRILALGEEGLEEHDNFYKTLFYADLLDKIRPTLDDKFTHDLPEDDSPQETIRKIINNILHLYYTAKEDITELTTEATGLQKRIDQLRAQLEVALKEAADMRDGDAAANKIIKEGVEGLRAQLAAAAAELDDIRAQVAVQQAAVSTCNTQLGAAKEAATAAGVKAAARIAELEAASSVNAAKISELNNAAAASATKLAAAEAERDRVTGEVAGLQAQIATLEAGKSGGVQAAALAEAQIATLQQTIDARTKTLKGINERAIETGKERDAALAAVEKQKGEIASSKAELEALRATIQGHVTAKDAAIAEREDAKAAAAAAAAASQGIIDGLQRDAATAKAAVAAAAAAAEEIKGKLTATDAELSELREKLKTCEASLVAARSASATEAGAAAEARAELVAEKARLSGEITRVTAERDSFKTQQAEEAGKVAAKTAELVTAQASAAALQAQIDKFNTDAAEAAEATQKRIAEFETQLGEKDRAAVAMGDEFRRQLDTARAAAATGLAEKLREKDAENAAAIQLAREALDESKRQLDEVKKEIVASGAAKNQVNAELGTVRKALKNKTTEYTANLAQKDAEFLAATQKAAAALEAAQKKATEDREEAAAAASAALAATTVALEARIKAATDRVSQIQAEAAAAAAAAKAASDKEIAGLRTLQLKLQAEAAAMQANLRQAGADTEAAKKATAALEAKNKELTANLAAITASKAKCDADAAAAAATAKAQIGNLTAQFRRQDEAAKQQGIQHAAALEKLRADHAVALAAATAKAAADAKTAFDKRVADLGGEKNVQIAAAEKGAREAAATELAAKLAKASAERQAAVDAARVEGRAAVTIEKDAAIAALQREGVAKEAAAVEAAVKAAKAEFVQRETQLAADREAAVEAAKKKVTDEKKGELERALAAAAVAATAATAVAVAASRDSVMTAAAAELNAEKERSRRAAATAREEGSAAARADDLEKLKQLASQVLAGQAKWTSYPGAAKNAALGQLLAKMDGRMSDICALVYFVSYFLNKMIRPSLVSGDEKSPAKQLITNVKNLVDRLAITSDKLFELLMAIEPALLLSNKVIPRGDERLMDTMNYLIKQKTETTLLKDLITYKSSIDPVVAWQVVRNSKDDATSMRFISMDNPKQVLFMHRPKLSGANDVKAADIRKGTIRTYSENGFLSSVVAEPVGALKGVIDAVDNGATPYVTYDVLFLVFLYASKKYIIDNKDSVPCTIPSEIINNSILKDSMQEREAQAAPAPKPVAPAAAAAVAPAPVAAARVAPAALPISVPPPKCVDVIFEPKFIPLNRSATLIKLGNTHVNYFKEYPFCFKEKGKLLLTSGSLYDYKFFQEQLNNVIGKVCRGEIQNYNIFLQPGFWQDIHKTGTMLPDESFLKDKIYDLTSATGKGNAVFRCNDTITKQKMGTWVSQSAAVGLQLPDLLKQAEESRITGKAPARAISPAAQAEANRLLAAAEASSAGQARRESAASVKANANAAVAAAAAARAAPGSWATQVQALRLPPRPSSALSVVELDTPVAPPAPPAACAVPIPVISAVATPNARTQFTGIVLNSVTAALLKSPPYCLSVEGYESIKAGNRYTIYNIRDLTDKITQKLPVGQKIPGFDTTPQTIQGKAVASVSINFKNMFPKKAQGFYFLDPPNKTTEQWAGRRTQKKKRNSKKFTQRKR